jgi:hypothetical protein
MPLVPSRNDPGDFPPIGGNSTGGGAAAAGAGSSGAAAGSSGGIGSAPIVASPTRSFSTGMYPVVRGTPDRVEYGPPVQIGPRDTVQISPIATNTTNCFYATGSPDAAKTGPRIVLTATSNPRVVRVRNLNEIGLYSTVPGEGITIDVQRG